MAQKPSHRTWKFDSYFGPLEIEAETEIQAIELYTKLLKRLFLLSHFIEVAFDRHSARRVRPPESGVPWERH